jgi:N-acetylmuramoyl-L-alanine amidase
VNPEETPAAEEQKEAARKEIKEPIAVSSGDLPPAETTVTAQNQPEQDEVKEEAKPIAKEIVAVEAVTEKPTPISEEPTITPKVEGAKEEVKKEEVVSDSEVVFKVQLLASSKVLPLLSEEFNGLSSLSTERYNNLVRYMYGKTNSYSQAKLYKANADAKGYASSFIVAYKDGKRIPVPEALKYVSE